MLLTPAPPEAPRWRRRRDARPSEITDAALALFAETGFAATPVAAIAARAGVTKGTVYLYFASKEDLFAAAVRERLVPMLEQGEALFAAHTGTSDDLLRRLVHGWWTVLSAPTHAAIPKLMTAEAAHFPELARFYVEEVVQRGRRLFAGVIRRGIERGEFRAVDPDTTARLAIAPLIQSVVHAQSLAPYDEPLDAGLFIATHIDLFLGGLRPMP